MSVKSALRDLNNAVLDLQSADYNTYERPLARLAQTLNGSDLAAITSDLRAVADFDAFLQRANQGGGMMGSARLNWPAGRKEELGLVIHIIERGAADPSWFLNFSHTYYYSGTKILADIRKITASVIIPFNRDFAVYVEEHAHDEPFQEAKLGKANEEDKKELLQALFELGRGGKRPSVQDAASKYLPEWDRDRLISVADALLEEGSVLNPTGAMLYVDLSSSARKRAEQSSREPSGVIYNIGEMHNSPLQHISSGGHGTQTTTYSSDDLRSIVALYRQHVDGLGLDDAQRRKADAQVATIEAQLMDEPDPSIIKSAGKSLKTIVEGAIGGAAGAAIAAAPVWAPLLSMFGG
ncbi:MAG: hypothetical protein U5N10_13030 [Gemmobacter sp.]|nr:hypothetical protein [Gemmobacter sp.]